MKVGQGLWGEVLENREAGAPCVRDGVASCNLAEEVHWDRLEVADQPQGEDSSCSEAAGGSSYYVLEAAPFVQAESSSCFEVEVGRHVRVEGSSCSEPGVLVLVEYSCYGGELAQD